MKPTKPPVQRKAEPSPSTHYAFVPKGARSLADLQLGDAGSVQLAVMKLEGQWVEITVHLRGNHPTRSQYKAWWGFYVPAAMRALVKEDEAHGRSYKAWSASQAHYEMFWRFARVRRSSQCSPALTKWVMDQTEQWMADYDEFLPTEGDRQHVEDDGVSVPAAVGEELERLAEREERPE